MRNYKHKFKIKKFLYNKITKKKNNNNNSNQIYMMIMQKIKLK